MKPDALPADATAHIETLQHWAQSALHPSLASGFHQDKKAAISALHVLGMLSIITEHYSDDNLPELIRESMDAEGARQYALAQKNGSDSKRIFWHPKALQELINTFPPGTAWKNIYRGLVGLKNDKISLIELVEEDGKEKLKLHPSDKTEDPETIGFRGLSNSSYIKR
jgi:hypothetical protein